MNNENNLLFTYMFIIIAVLIIGGVIFGGYYFMTKGNSINLAVEPPIGGSTATLGGEASKSVIAVMKTNFGDIKLELFANDAPKTVENFVKLAKQGFYDGTKFHRVIKNFMIQGGDPNSKDDDWSNDGTGGPGYSFADEINPNKIVRGTLAMANSGPNTNGSQFFIVTTQATPWLDGKHTAFGKVTAGIDVVDKIENVKTDKARGDHPIDDVIVNKIVIE